MRVYGIDFTSSPTARKPIAVACGTLTGSVLAVEDIERYSGFAAFERWLHTPGPWIGGFDLPFGLPRELVEQLDWPRSYAALMAAVAAHTRADLRARFKAFCAARPAGAKFAHRACDRPAGSSPSMKWVNPPVAYMLHAGVPRAGSRGPATRANGWRCRPRRARRRANASSMRFRSARPAWPCMCVWRPGSNGRWPKTVAAICSMP